MLPRLQFAQVGDVHLPGTLSAGRNVDNKDPRFPTALHNQVSRQPTRTVFEQLYRLIECKALKAVLFMGDLTDIGSIDGYQSCSNYIARALQLGSKGIHSDTPVGIVPGNHDIDRNLAIQPSVTAKFAPLNQALANAGLPPLPVQKPRWLALNEKASGAKVALMNSCWGCGAKEFIPEDFRADVSAAIDAAIKRGHDGKATKTYYDRQFDTPAFDDASINELISSATSTPQDQLLIVCAHHNLLPQRLTRLAPYTELINSGVLRGALQVLSRPVVYLHGHIHEDPIDIIQAPKGDPLICISAPEASAGFNVIELVFTRTGIPLSCHILRWRFDESLVFRQVDRQAISLIGHRRRGESSALARLYAHLLNEREVYWAELLKIGAQFFTTDIESQLEEAIELLAADGRLTIDNYDMPPSAWIVGASL
jgi:Calcineurin-like phosphoesterase